MTGLKGNFKEELAFYGSYHQDPRNQLIHFIFVPLIWWTANIWMCYVSLFKFRGHQISWGTVMLMLYVLYYLSLDTRGGGAFSVVLTAMYLISTELVKRERAKVGSKDAPISRPGRAGKIGVVIHILAWYMQLHPGHAIFEGVKPALIDSLSQAIAVAPLFAFYEGVWFMGFEDDLKQQVVQLVNATRIGMCENDNSLSFCS